PSIWRSSTRRSTSRIETVPLEATPVFGSTRTSLPELRAVGSPGRGARPAQLLTYARLRGPSTTVYGARPTGTWVRRPLSRSTIPTALLRLNVTQSAPRAASSAIPPGEEGFFIASLGASPSVDGFAVRSGPGS